MNKNLTAFVDADSVNLPSSTLAKRLGGSVELALDGVGTRSSLSRDFGL